MDVNQLIMCAASHSLNISIWSLYNTRWFVAKNHLEAAQCKNLSEKGYCSLKNTC